MALPFGGAEFDFVWCANVAQYLTDAEFAKTLAEFQRVAKPGAIVAVKEYDCLLTDMRPMDDDYVGRLWAARRARATDGALGPWGGSSLGSRIRQAGLSQISCKGWLIERWAPPSRPVRTFIEGFLPRWAALSAQGDLPAKDAEFWRQLAADPSRLLDDPDFCYREFFVVTTGRTPG